MIDVLTEAIEPVLEAANKYMPKRNGKRVHASTLWRWCTNGVRGVRLETVFIGGSRCTSREAIQRFVEQVTAAREGRPETVARPSRKRRIAEARRVLRHAGIG